MALRLLIDTHVLLWALTDPERLSARARDAIVAGSTRVCVSAASAWEIATKHRNGKLPQADALVLGYAEHLVRLGAEEIPVSSRHAFTAGAFEWGHRDPFDRMLAAQSILESLPLVTSDPVFQGMPGVRVLW